VADYGPAESVSAEGWALLLFVAGLCIWVGAFAYADPAAFQAGLAVLGFVLDGLALAILWRAKRKHGVTAGSKP